MNPDVRTVFDERHRMRRDHHRGHALGHALHVRIIQRVPLGSSGKCRLVPGQVDADGPFQGGRASASVRLTPDAEHPQIFRRGIHYIVFRGSPVGLSTGLRRFVEVRFGATIKDDLLAAGKKHIVGEEDVVPTR